jgi:orotate phosphoribosyltransferase
VTTDLRAHLRDLIRRDAGVGADGGPDLTPVLLSAEGINTAAFCLLEAIRDHEVTHVGGEVAAAGPLATAVSLAAFRAGVAIDAFTIWPCDAGTSRIRGPLAPGSRVAVVADQAGAGDQLLEAIRVVEQVAACSVGRVVVVLDLEEGAALALQRAGHELHALLRQSQL